MLLNRKQTSTRRNPNWTRDKRLETEAVTNNLHHAAKKYVEVIEKIERTTDPEALQALEEKRIDLRWKFIDLLKKQGIKYKDREHATRIAIRIAHGEL
jgi:ribosomal protein L22